MDISFNLRKLRRSIAGLTMLALLATMSFAGIAKAQTFSDVDTDDWYYEYVEDLVGQGVISGYDDGTFGPGDMLTRAQAAKMMVLAYADETDPDYDAGFSDVDEDAWYSEYVNTAAKLGIVGGYTDEEGDATGEFGPDDYITRAAFAKMVVNGGSLETNTDGAPHFSDVDEGAWYYDYVETAYHWMVVDGYDDGTFGPGDNVNRAEASKMVLNGQAPEARSEDTDDDTEDCEEGYEWNENTEACEEVVVTDSDGTLEVEMGDTVSGASLPKGATSVEVLKLEFTADGDDVELDGFTLHRAGVGSSSDFSYVYLYDGDTRLTTGKTVSSSTNEVTFGSLNLDIEDGDTQVITVVVDFSSSATTGDENYLSLVGADKVDSNAAEVSGTFSVEGELFTIAGASAGTIEINKYGSVPNPTIGEQDAEIAEFKLTASTEDQAVKRVNLVFKGTINAGDALTDLKMYQGSDLVATADSVNSSTDLGTFVIDGTFSCDDFGYTDDGFCIAKGNSKTFTVTADIGTSADPNNTIKVYLDESTDLESEGLVYGYGAQVTYTTAADGYDNASDDGTDASHSTVQGGQFTVTHDGPNPSDIAINSKDVILNKMTVTSERNVEIRQLQVDLTATGSGLADTVVRNFTDFKIVEIDEDDNIVDTLMGPQEVALTDTTTKTLTFTNSWEMSEDEEKMIAITCDVSNYDSLNTTTLQADLTAISTTAGVRDVDTNEYLTDIVPSTAVTGKTMTVKSSSLAVSLASFPTSDTFVKGTAGVQLGGFAMTAGDAMDVTLTSVVLAGYLDDNDSGSDYTQGTDNSVDIKNIVSSVWITDEAGTQLGTSETFSSGDATFSGLSWTIPAGTTEVLKVYGNFSNSAFYNSTNDYVHVDLDDVSADLAVQDEEGNTVTATGDNANGTEDSPSVAMTITGGGTIAFADATADAVESQIVAQQETDVLVARYKVTSTDEDFEVAKLVFTATDSAGAGSTAAGLVDNVASLTLKYPTDVDTPSTLDGEKTVTMSGTNVKMTSLGMMVPKDEDVYMELYADFNAHALDGGGLDSDDALYFTLNTGDGDGEANGDLEVTGQGSGTGYTEDEISDVTSANVTYVYRTVPTVANDTSLGSSFIQGADQEIYRFTVSANENEDVGIRFLTLDISVTGLVTGNVANSLTNDAGADAGGTYNACVGTASYSTAPVFVKEYGKTTVVGTGCVDTTNNKIRIELEASNGTANSGLVVGKGATKTLSVFADLYPDSDTSTSESVSVKIKEDTTHYAADAMKDLQSTLQTEVSGAGTGMIWTDYGHATAAVHDYVVNEWYVGYKVPGMPVSYMSLT